MKKLVLIILLFSSLFIYAQGSWQWVNPKPAYESINSIQIINKSLIFAVGDNGLIMRSDNSGLNWSVLERDSTLKYSKIQFININTGYLIGRVERGSNVDFIKKTTNAGLSWSIIKNTINNTYLDMYFINEQTGYTTGWNNFIIKTTNGGSSWDSTSFDFGNSLYWMEHLEFVNANTGFILGSNYDQYDHFAKILKTTNGGNNWQYIINDTNNYYRSIHFFNSSTGYLVKNQELLKTTNSGENWFSFRDLSNFLQYGFATFKFIDENNFYLTSDYYYGRNIVAQTSDAGSSWNVGYVNSLYNLHCIDVYDNLVFSGGSFGNFLYSSTGGSNWSNYNFSYDEMSRSDFLNSDVFYIAGELGHFFRTTNGGESFTTKIIYPDTTQQSLPISVKFINANTGFYFGDKCRFYRTSDGGENWTRLLDSCTGARFTSYSNMFFLDQFNGYLIGGHSEYGYHWSYFSKTTNAGQTWIEINTNNPSAGDNFYFANEQIGYITGYEGLWKTINGGNNWFKFLEGTEFSNIYFKDPDNFYRIENNTVYKSINSGVSWTPVHSADYYEIVHDIFFTENTDYLLIENQTAEGYTKISKSTDNGSNWSSKIIADRLDLHKIYFTDESTGYLMGAFGRILKTTDAGGSFDPSIPPYRFYLYQNYPNPFNPSTSIRYEVPVMDHTTLKLYDILGREISTLVNEVNSAGIHVINETFNELASGIYFLKLVQGSYVQSRKISLVK